MKRKSILFFIAFLFFIQSAHSTMYECDYKNKKGRQIVTSFNSFVPARANYFELLGKQKAGYCKELIIRKYFFDGVACNIQFYKYNGAIAGMGCFGNKQSALIKLKALAKKEFGYN